MHTRLVQKTSEADMCLSTIKIYIYIFFFWPKCIQKISIIEKSKELVEKTLVMMYKPFAEKKEDIF